MGVIWLGRFLWVSGCCIGGDSVVVIRPRAQKHQRGRICGAPFINVAQWVRDVFPDFFVRFPSEYGESVLRAEVCYAI